MRTLGEILDAVHSGHDATHDECYYALAVLELLWNMDRNEYMEIATDESRKRFARMYFDESFARGKRAFAADPRQWLGDEWDPKNPAVQERRKHANALFERIIAGGTP